MDLLPHIVFRSSLPRDGGWSQSLAPASLVLRCESTTRVATLTSPRGIVMTWTDPLDALAWMADNFEGDARWAGYLSYDLGRCFEPLPARATDDLQLPLFVFSRHGFGPETSRPDEKCPELPPDGRPLVSSLPRQVYLQRVRRAIDYIQAGDIFQVNLAQRFTAGLKLTPQEVWRRLIFNSPADYGAFLDYGDFALLSNSPELFLQVTPDRRVITRPIKGTRPRETGGEVELAASEKDAAELNMIVDLERNDLGRVCEIGSVRVTQPRTVEAHPTVYHGVATVEGRLRGDVDFVALLRATFPGGSITGAPKIRAMQIIDELEPVARGPYCGAIGYIAADGSMQFNVAIRTMILKAGRAHVPVGGGIVADSDPDSEYEETLVKAKAMFDALGITR